MRWRAAAKLNVAQSMLKQSLKISLRKKILFEA
jgi:hypothetical protein